MLKWNMFNNYKIAIDKIILLCYNVFVVNGNDK